MKRSIVCIKQNSGEPLKSVITSSVLPFLGFLYFSSILTGALAGRLVRITRIDTKFKLLRFKNYWFYVFTGEQTKFKKLKHLKERKKKHLFTVADILIDSNNKTHLYSGIVVDYELQDDNCQSLSKVMLQNAERYSLREGKRVPVSIPGNLLVVDCSHLKNINLTYVYEKVDDFLSSRTPSIVYNTFSLLIVLLIPFFIFQIELIHWNVYENYFGFPWYKKILGYLFVVQLISLTNPFNKNKSKEEYEYVGWKLFTAKLVVGVVFGAILYFI